ncbi:MAG: MBOAT family protein, partial [Proteocatella sp.]|nr:MBOAT family protein [Proteocatella sp.]
IYTMTIVIFGWVLFRSAGITEAIDYIRSMLGMGSGAATEPIAVLYLHDYRFAYIAGIIACFPVISRAKAFYDRRKSDRICCAAIELSFISALAVLFLISASYLIKGTYNPFIYFNF